jgi:hypothetical protein
MAEHYAKDFRAPDTPGSPAAMGLDPNRHHIVKIRMDVVRPC